MEKNANTPEWIDGLIYWFSSHLSEIGIATVFLILGAAIAWGLHRRALVGNQISYQLEDFRLLGYEKQPLPKAIGIMFDDLPVEKLNRVFLILWSSGRDTIHRDDIVDSDPLRLVFNRSRVLDAKVTHTSRDQKIINAAVMPEVTINTPDKGLEISITFDFLDKDDGMIVEVYHEPVPVDQLDEEDEKKPMMYLAGTIKGIRTGPQYFRWNPNPKLGEDLFGIVMGLVTGSAAALSIGYFFRTGSLAAVIAMTTWAIFVLPASMWMIYQLYNTFTNRPPKALRTP